MNLCFRISSLIFIGKILSEYKQLKALGETCLKSWFYRSTETQHAFNALLSMEWWLIGSEVSFHRRVCSEGKLAWRHFQLVIYCSSESWVETDWKLVKCDVKTVRTNNKHRYRTFKRGSYSITTDNVENLHDDSQNALITNVTRFMWS